MLSQKENLIKDGWIETTLGEVCEISYGKDHKNLSVGEIPCYGSGGFMRNVETFLYDKPSVLIPRKGTISNLFYVDKPFWTVDTLFYTKIDEGLIASKFLFYKLKNEKLEDLNVGSAVPSLTTSVLNQFLIFLPPLPEQKSIATVLSSFDDKIELLREENKTLEEIGQTIFKEWFGKYSVYKPEELPEGWRVGKLGEENFAEIIGSGVNKFDGEKIYLATADVSDSNIINASEKITFQERPSRANMQPIEKSIWFAKMQYSRKLLMFDDYSEFEIENFILSTGFAGIKTTEISHYFIWCFILSKDFDELKNNMANGAVQVAVNNTNLEKIEIIIPDNKTLIEFNESAKPIFKKIYNNNSQIQSLSNSRDELLPRLMKGEVRVK